MSFADDDNLVKSIDACVSWPHCAIHLDIIIVGVFWGVFARRQRRLTVSSSPALHQPTNQVPTNQLTEPIENESQTYIIHIQQHLYYNVCLRNGYFGVVTEFFKLPRSALQ